MTSKAVPNAEQQILRILDANFNRAREGFRVCEDTCRFLLDAPELTRKYKAARHDLTALLKRLPVLELIQAREAGADVGRRSSSTEFLRRGVKDVFYANSQRVKESIRVLEEFVKLLDPKVAEELKSLRYRVYVLEQQVVKALK